MKEVYFKSSYKIGKRTEKRTGLIVINAQGKISVSVNESKYHSGASNYFIKNLAKEIIESDYNHPAITNKFGFEKEIEDLVVSLTEQTKVSLTEYLERVEEWSEKTLMIL